MKPLSQPELNRLLSGRDRLTQADKDAVLEQVLARLPAEEAPRPERGLWTWVRWASAAAVLLVAVPVGYLLLARPADTWTARGGAESQPSFEVACAGPSGRCARGGKLLFAVDARGARFFAALARSPTGEIIWYFTGAEVAAVPPGGLLDVGIPLGPEHAPGTWEVLGFFSAQPADKPELRSLLRPGATPVPGVTTVRRKLEIAP